MISPVTCHEFKAATGSLTQPKPGQQKRENKRGEERRGEERRI
jgi:hypothetical protein